MPVMQYKKGGIYVKICKKHGKQRMSYSYCPYCGSQLEEVNPGETLIELPSIQLSDNFVEHLACLEATCTAWNSIGIHGPVAMRLARSGIGPESLQALLKTHSVKGIGLKTRDVISKLDKTDIDQFENICKTFMRKGSWCWQLAEWYASLPDGCTNGEYEIKKNYFKNKQLFLVDMLTI